AAFEVLGLIALGPAGRRIAVLGDMLELGSESPDLHAGLCDSLIEHKIDLVHCCGPLMRHLYDTLPATIKGDYAPDSTALATNLTDGLRDGDVVMVKGSKGSRMDFIVDAIRTLGDKQCKAVS
ncbi:MAG: UDP-N-acetylmuramoylalanyl-D-glutamyl-2, 6-diaminopimelate--D-alanyl-D-alanine ligase, partial [Bdellovibrionales bacterium]